MGLQNPGISISSLTGACTEAFEYDPATKVVIYHGWAPPGVGKDQESWAIAKFTYDADLQVTDIQWAEGSTALHLVWDDRATYSYS